MNDELRKMSNRKTQHLDFGALHLTVAVTMAGRAWRRVVAMHSENLEDHWMTSRRNLELQTISNFPFFVSMDLACDD